MVFLLSGVIANTTQFVGRTVLLMRQQQTILNAVRNRKQFLPRRPCRAYTIN